MGQAVSELGAGLGSAVDSAVDRINLFSDRLGHELDAKMESLLPLSALEEVLTPKISRKQTIRPETPSTRLEQSSRSTIRKSKLSEDTNQQTAPKSTSPWSWNWDDTESKPCSPPRYISLDPPPFSPAALRRFEARVSNSVSAYVQHISQNMPVIVTTGCTWDQIY